MLSLSKSVPDLPEGVFITNDTTLYPVVGPPSGVGAQQSGVGRESASDSDYIGLTGTQVQWQFRPLLVDKCYSCHSAKAKKLKGGLLLDTRAGVINGGDSGPAIVPGHPEQSRLMEAVRWGNPDLQMPPKKRLPDAEAAVLEEWQPEQQPMRQEASAGMAMVRTLSGMVTAWPATWRRICWAA